MNPVEIDILAHVGVSKLDGAPIGSGRYPLGSGDNPYQRPGDFRDRVAALRRDGLTDKEIASYFGYSTTRLRQELSADKNAEDVETYKQIKALQAKGITSATEIGRELGKNESTIRGLLEREEKFNRSSARTTADYLKAMVDEKGMIDVGDGVEAELGITREKLNSALTILEYEGYPHYSGRFDQVTDKTGGHKTTQMVLGPPGTEHKDIYNLENVHTIQEYDKILTENGHAVRNAFEYPASMDPSRLKIRYAGEQGGELKDGVIEIRPGVQDLSLGEGVHYAQVRVLVGDTHYLKGMAVYGDPKTMPEGVDVIFNTNKKEGVPALGPKDNTVLKPIEKDADNPFGSAIKPFERGGQMYYDDPKGKFIDPETGNKQSLSLINKRADQNDWNDWKDTLATQFLSKQPLETIQKQLELSKADKVAEYEEIMAYTNPTVKKKLLQEFASKCDGNAVDLKAAAFPDQKYKVILPMTTQKDNEIYAPDYKDGTQVALIRYPHAGLFEIPILKVNNKNAEGQQMIGNETRSAVGITKKVADQLSGADFDGDTVMVIPLSSKVKVQTAPPLKELNGFDSKQYKHDGDYPRMKKGAQTQQEMGEISNLITDMTVGGASSEELARAVKHSMVVIDAAKHGLDYRQSYIDNGIKELKDTYQGRMINGRWSTKAATLISAAKGEYSAPKSQGSPRINQKGKPWYDPDRPEGSLIYKTAPDNLRYYTDPKGKTQERFRRSTNMAETDDAYTLVSKMRSPKELAYADYANFMKGLANKARLDMLNTGSIKYSVSARETYKDEVASLEAQLKLAKMNRPRERAAHRLAISRVQAKKKAYENAGLTKNEYKSLLDKERQRALTDARNTVGAKRKPIIFTEREWKAVQAGAISDSKLSDMLKYADMSNVKSLALPKRSNTITVAQQAKIKAMAASGYTLADIAEAVGCAKSTVANYTS